MPNRKSKSGMTREQFAATEFKAIPENTNEERKECHEEGLDVVSVVSRMSIHLLGPEKRELVANIKKMAAMDGSKSAGENGSLFRAGARANGCIIDSDRVRRVPVRCVMASVFNEDGSVKGHIH